MNTVLIVGANSGIGGALASHYIALNARVITASRSNWLPTQLNSSHTHYTLDSYQEPCIGRFFNAIPDIRFDIVIVCNGVLHSPQDTPERKIADINAQSMQRLFEANCIVPTLIAKYCSNRFANNHAIFACLSARVSSIADNRLGGWYSYRATKSALNMIIKTYSIELSRKYDKAIVVGIHPGTVDTQLSKPFSRSIKTGQLTSAKQAASNIANVICNLAVNQSGQLLAYDGSQIPW